jgi:hypothetical protein
MALAWWRPATIGRTRWTTSMACSFLWFKSVIFLSLVYCLCYRSQWRPELAATNMECQYFRSNQHTLLAKLYYVATSYDPELGMFHVKNTEWIWDDPYDTWNFPASQAITVQKCKVLHWSSRRYFEHFHSSGWPNSEAMLHKACVHNTSLLVLCKITFCRFGRAFSLTVYSRYSFLLSFKIKQFSRIFGT